MFQINYEQIKLEDYEYYKTIYVGQVNIVKRRAIASVASHFHFLYASESAKSFAHCVSSSN